MIRRRKPLYKRIETPGEPTGESFMGSMPAVPGEVEREEFARDLNRLKDLERGVVPTDLGLTAIEGTGVMLSKRRSMQVPMISDVLLPGIF